MTLRGREPGCPWCGDTLRGSVIRDDRVWCVCCGYPYDGHDEAIGAGELVMVLVGLVIPEHPTGFEGQMLVGYDPTRQGWDRYGKPMVAWIETTADPDRALRFVDMAAARRLWMRCDGRERVDGRPNRPLTAFNIEITRPPAMRPH